MGGCCGAFCRLDHNGLPGGGEYRVRRTADYDRKSAASSFNSAACEVFERLSRTSTFHGVDADEPSPNEHAFQRKVAVCHAGCVNGVTSDPDQFLDEIKESAPEVKVKDNLRVTEWVDSIISMNKHHGKLHFPPLPPKLEKRPTSPVGAAINSSVSPPDPSLELQRAI